MKTTSLFLLVLFLGFAQLHADPAPGTPPSSIPPRPELPPPPSTVNLIRDVVYGQAGGHPLYLHLALPETLPDKPMPAIILIHGGGWHQGTRAADVGEAYIFAGHGYVAASIEYRLAQEAPFPAQLEDCKCAVRFLRAKAADYHIDAGRIAVMGDSAGGHLSALMGLTNGMKEFEGDGGWADQSSSVQAVCDWYGPTDLVAWVKGNPKLAKDPFLPLFFGGTVADHPEKAAYASPMTYVSGSKDTPPFLIMHGDQDPLVPVQQSIMLAEALIAAGDDVTLHVIKGAAHGGPGWGLKKPWPEVIEFFDHNLKGE
ncbi:MAG: alpha/beta hydrolase [Methylacidiphilales bacterium]|nr:alpha/beta hydrolase [Candidatus Methylacidiphilales bacterium]